MSGVKPKGYQLNIADIASNIAADSTAIRGLASGMLSDVTSNAELSTEFVRRDGTQSLMGNLDVNGHNLINVGIVDGRDVSSDGSLLDLHLGDLSKHRLINDAGSATTELWSANKISTEFDGLGMNSLSDVNVPSPSVGDILVFNGSVWGPLAYNKRYEGSVQTTDETTTTITTVNMVDNSVSTFVAYVQGYEITTGNMKSEVIRGAIKNHGGTTIIVGSNDEFGYEDVGSSSWSVAAIANNGTNSLEVTVTGQAGKTIAWRSRVELLIG